MEQVRTMIASPALESLRPLLAGLGGFLIGLGIRWALLVRLQKLAERTKWTWCNLLVRALRGPSVLWCLIAALYLMVIASPVSSRMEHLASLALSVLWLVSVTLAALQLADQMIRQYGARFSAALPLTSLTQNLAKTAIGVLGGLMVLNSLGISIAPVLTALGLGGLAVALALQETLTNLFAGIYLTLARQVRVGDYIKLDSGEEGYVMDIAWRSIRVRSLPNNLLIIPNTKLAQAIVTNFDLPSQDLAVLVEAGVDYRSDLEKVERVTIEVGRETLKNVPGGVQGFDPFIRFHTFGPSSVNFTVILRGKTFVDQYLVKHEFIKRLHRAFAQEGIVIPFPIQTVIMESASRSPQG